MYATKTQATERAKGIRRVAIPSEGKSVKCRANKSTGDGSSANRGIAPKHQIRDDGSLSVLSHSKFQDEPNKPTARPLCDKSVANVWLVISYASATRLVRVRPPLTLEMKHTLVATKCGDLENCNLLNGF